MSQVFKAWAPNVAGALSFSTAGSGCYPTPPVRANLGDQHVRYIIAYQDRNLLDAVIPMFARIRRLAGDFICLCVGTCSDNPLEPGDQMSGRLFIFHDFDAWKLEPSILVGEAQKKLREFAKTSAPNGNLSNYFHPTYTNLLNQITSESSFFVDFELTRSGMVTLTIPDDYENKVSSHAPKFPVGQLERQHMERVVCSQLFFFLKDLAHTHQHHDPKLDTLVDIHPFDGNETEWRSKTLRYLYRKVIEYKRNARINNYHSSLGILIYAKSFRSISAKDNIKDLPPIIQDELLEEAIKAGLQNTCTVIDHSGESPKKQIDFFIAFGTFIITIAMLLSLTKYADGNPRPDAVLKALGDLLVCYTFPTIATSYVFYLVMNMKFNGKIDLFKSRYSRIFLLLLQPLSQFVAAMIPILIGIIAVIACVVFLNYWYDFPVFKLLLPLVNGYEFYLPLGLKRLLAWLHLGNY